MAIRKDFEYKGLVVVGAYIRVNNLCGNKSSLGITVGIYTSTDNLITTSDYQFDYNVDGANPFVQAYEYIKTLPEYTDAIDC